MFGCGKNQVRPDAGEIAYGLHETQRFDLYAPKRNSSGLVVLIHGGGWHQGSRQDTLWLVPKFLSQGYSVATLGYRLFAQAPAPAAAEDVREGLAQIRRIAPAHGVDLKRTAIIGFSAGAHLALLSVLAPTERVRGPRIPAAAIVSFWGITDVEDLVTGPNRREFAMRWIGQGNYAEKLARDLSPVAYIPPEHTALLAIHSIHDPVVPFPQSERLVANWRTAGRHAELLQLSHEGHAPPRMDYAPLLDRVYQFLAGTFNRTGASL